MFLEATQASSQAFPPSNPLFDNMQNGWLASLVCVIKWNRPSTLILLAALRGLAVTRKQTV